MYRTPHGRIYNLYEDMTNQPHLLIAGITGSGKSVVVNGIITTLLFKTPQEVGLILIDPKRVELSMYKNLPHTMYYASEPQEMLNALIYAMDIVDARFQQMQARGERLYSGSDIYVIIDEWADLMTTQKQKVAPLVQRLAQIGRASKVHIILCTQTPIAKIIPTEIKCNFDSRLGLRTRSAQDSRNIISRAGLELLPRYGKGVYMTPQGECEKRIPYIDDYERERLVRFWVLQQERIDSEKKKRRWKLW